MSILNSLAFGQNKNLTDKIEFDHFYFVIPDSVYQNVINHPDVISQFANVDKGWPLFEKIDSRKKEAYFRFENSYFELLSDQNKWSEPVNKLGIGWVSNQINNQDEIENWLRKQYTASLQKWDEKDSIGNGLYSTFYVKYDSEHKTQLDFWAQQFYPKFVENNFGKQNPPIDITAKTYRADKYFSKDKIANEITEIGLELSEIDFEKLSVWLKTLGYKIADHKNFTEFIKDGLAIKLYHSDFNRLWFIKFLNNSHDVKIKQIFINSNSRIDIEKDYSVWWFHNP